MSSTAAWRLRDLAVALVVVAFISIQVLVPALTLAEPRPTRFGWQMYTAMVSLPSVWTETDDGRRQAVDTGNLLARERGEIDLSRALAERLCQDPEVAAVVVERFGQQQRWPCR